MGRQDDIRMSVMAVLSLLLLYRWLGWYGVLGWQIGFFGFQATSAKEAGMPNRVGGLDSSMRFRVRTYEVHMHHWLYLTLIGLTLIGLQHANDEKKLPHAVYATGVGFCVGGIVQGFKYSDWYSVISKRDMFE